MDFKISLSSSLVGMRSGWGSSEVVAWMIATASSNECMRASSLAIFFSRCSAAAHAKLDERMKVTLGTKPRLVSPTDCRLPAEVCLEAENGLDELESEGWNTDHLGTAHRSHG